MTRFVKDGFEFASTESNDMSSDLSLVVWNLV